MESEEDAIRSAKIGEIESVPDTPSKSCLRAHLNNLWSVWYGLLLTALNSYIALHSAKRFFGKFCYSSPQPPFSNRKKPKQ